MLHAYNNEFGIWIIHSFLALHVIKLMMFDNMTIDHCNSKEYFEFSHKLRKGSRNSDNFLAQSSIIPAKVGSQNIPSFRKKSPESIQQRWSDSGIARL